LTQSIRTFLQNAKQLQAVGQSLTLSAVPIMGIHQILDNVAVLYETATVLAITALTVGLKQAM
jgi:hypothetical protein